MPKCRMLKIVYFPLRQMSRTEMVAPEFCLTHELMNEKFRFFIARYRMISKMPDFQMRQVLRTHPDTAASFAQMLVTEGPNGEPLADINQVRALRYHPTLFSVEEFSFIDR